MTRAVLDTNVWVSGLLWKGAAHTVIQAVRDGELVCISSPALIAELAEVLSRTKFATILLRAQLSRNDLLADMRLMTEIMEPAPLPNPVCRDPDDDHVLALALAAQAEFIVSGDDDLLTLHTFGGIAIVSPAAAIEHLLR